MYVFKKRYRPLQLHCPSQVQLTHFHTGVLLCILLGFCSSSCVVHCSWLWQRWLCLVLWLLGCRRIHQFACKGSKWVSRDEAMHPCRTKTSLIKSHTRLLLCYLLGFCSSSCVVHCSWLWQRWLCLVLWLLGCRRIHQFACKGSKWVSRDEAMHPCRTKTSLIKSHTRLLLCYLLGFCSSSCVVHCSWLWQRWLCLVLWLLGCRRIHQFSCKGSKWVSRDEAMHPCRTKTSLIKSHTRLLLCYLLGFCSSSCVVNSSWLWQRWLCLVLWLLGCRRIHQFACKGSKWVSRDEAMHPCWTKTSLIKSHTRLLLCYLLGFCSSSCVVHCSSSCVVHCSWLWQRWLCLVLWLLGCRRIHQFACKGSKWVSRDGAMHPCRTKTSLIKSHTRVLLCYLLGFCRVVPTSFVLYSINKNMPRMLT